MFVIASAAAQGRPSLHAQSNSTLGGFLEPSTSSAIRAPLSAASAQALFPERGAFRFPAPYNTLGIRLTTAGDCRGSDCVKPVGYSYWSNINNHAGSDTLLVFVTLDRDRGGAGPSVISVNKNTGETRNLGPVFPETSNFSWSSGEGWYFSHTRPHTLYINDGPRLLRYDVQSRTFETVFDVTARFGANRYIWQVHSSADDRVHSATLRDSSTYAELACVAYGEDRSQWYFVARRGDFDECQIDKSGRWLVIKENVDGRNGEDNRVIDLQTGTERILLDEDGAGGHSDLGFGYMVAADNYHPTPGAIRLWRFDLELRGGEPRSPVPGQGTLVNRQTSWSGNLGHVAHGNTRAGVPPERQIACSSNANRLSLPRANEIVCFRLDGSPDTLVVAPTLSNLNAAGGGSDDYSKMPKGNLDPTGEYFVWTANAGSGRLDAFLVRVPLGLLGGGGTTGNAPGPPTIDAAVSGNQITASWGPGPGTSPTSFVVSVGTSPGGSELFHQNVGLTTSGAATLPDGTYFVRVTAVNAAGTASSDRTFVVSAGRPPGPPWARVTVNGNVVNASWSPGAGNAPEWYGVALGTSPGAFNIFQGVVGLVTSASATLPAGTYYLRVYAGNAAGWSYTDRTFAVR
jgi:hypothetical protein